MDNAGRARKAIEMAGGGLSVSSACRAAGISRKTFYKWKARLASAESGRGEAPPAQDAAGQDWRSMALSLCLRHPDWGCDRIAYFLHLHGVKVSSPTIQKHLIRHGLGRVHQRMAILQERAEGAADPLDPGQGRS